ncbi:DsrE family protein [Flavihumibacter profundi]|uniref:DsrE family protein n=1 Tax=Flavihumibacter profundi TaxID=2716883 RepID=UPI001CC40C0C|nr:DsrE family protein [Flavihumibacter profundi]MBZ5856554.1 DsrE family protein [Flavihumibacter profundi]
MKKIIISCAVLFICSLSVCAQQKQHKIVWDLESADTADYRGIIRQINNVLKVAPDARIEVVCHGPAVYALIDGKTNIKDKIDELKASKNVVFAACANSLKRLNLTPEQVIPSAIVVPVSILEMAGKQEEGWSYIKY